VFILVALIVLLAFAFVRLRVGYPVPDRPLVILTHAEAAFLAAAAATFFPALDEDGRAASKVLRPGEAVDLPGYMDDYLGQLPKRQRFQIRALLMLFEQSSVVFPARGLGAFKRFSSMSPAQQRHVMRAWAESRLYLRRIAFIALKALLVLGYLGDDTNLRALGLAPWKIESPVIETDLIYPSIGARPEQIAFTLEDLAAPGVDARSAPPLRGVEERT
jgi:hypothetical protein